MSLPLNGLAPRVIPVLDLDPRRLTIGAIRCIGALRHDGLLIVLDDCAKEGVAVRLDLLNDLDTGRRLHMTV
jgi:hypothetical protein